MIRRKERPEGDGTARFAPGQLVHHRRYGYRGVVVDLDAACQAPEEWYLSNKTQPPKDQPWYHVLVNGTPQVTYAAETSLEEDFSGQEVLHPLLEVYFEGFKAGSYVRNDRKWGE